MSWPKGWRRQDINSSPGATDEKQHVFISDGRIKSFGPVDVPVKVISVLLAIPQETSEEPTMWDAHLITWTETERGWGCRPDGVSLHLSATDARKYVADYWEREKAQNPSGEVPHEYSRPDDDGSPVLVSKEIYDQIRESHNGIRLWSSKVSELKKKGDIQKLAEH